MLSQRKGIFYAVLAFSLWGVYPVYWWFLSEIGAEEILINRMFWSFITMLIIIIVLRLYRDLKKNIVELWSDKKKLILLVVAVVLLGLNWFLFTYAVTTERALEASLGYYINPILSILIAVIILKERLNRFQVLAVCIASVGVLYQTFAIGIFPWISLILAGTWGFYALTKKLIGIDAFFSLFLETTLMLPFSGFFFTSWILDGTSAFKANDSIHILLLMGAGIITIVPLYLFSKAAVVLPLKTIGFLQYVGPTIQMSVAVLIMGESLTLERVITFIFIWTACMFFSTSHILEKKFINRL